MAAQKFEANHSAKLRVGIRQPGSLVGFPRIPTLLVGSEKFRMFRRPTRAIKAIKELGSLPPAAFPVMVNKFARVLL